MMARCLSPDIHVARRQCIVGIQVPSKFLVKVFMQNMAMSYNPPRRRKLPVRDACDCAGKKMVEEANDFL